MTGILGMQRMRWEDQQHRKNREAEESHARQIAWGAADTMADDEMGDQIQIGDTANHYHGEKSSDSNNLAKTILCAGLAAGSAGLGVTAPILAWNLSRPQPIEEVSGADADTKYGLQIFKDQPPE